MILKGSGFSKPELVWSLLIKNSLQYSSKRVSINGEGLKNVLDKFRITADEWLTPQQPNRSANIQIPDDHRIPCGKEILFIKSFIPDYDYLVVELFRFDSTSAKKIRFNGQKLLLKKGNQECDVIFRGATYVSLERFFENEGDKFREARIAFIPANNISDVEDTEDAKLYSAYFDDLFRMNSKPKACLHCGKEVIIQDGLLIEIDEPTLPPSAGIVHLTCRRPLDRVVGLAKVDSEGTEKLPEGFDLSAWVESLQRGQALMNGISSGYLPKGRDITILWSSNFEHDPDYRYCVRFHLADGSAIYSHERGKVLRLSREQAEFVVRSFTETIRRQQDLNDPCGFTSKREVYGNYSSLLTLKGEDEEILEIRAAEIAPYSELLSKLYNKSDNYYAPMAIVRDATSEIPLCILGLIPLISDPLNFHRFTKNWRDAGFKFGELRLKVIKNDRDFDNWMRTFFADGFYPIIDPLFDKNQKRVGGVLIRHQEAFMEEAALQNKQK